MLQSAHEEILIPISNRTYPMRSAILTASLVLHSPTPATYSLLDVDMPDIQVHTHPPFSLLLLWDRDHGRLARASSDVAIDVKFEERPNTDPKRNLRYYQERRDMHVHLECSVLYSPSTCFENDRIQRLKPSTHMRVSRKPLGHQSGSQLWVDDSCRV